MDHKTLFPIELDPFNNYQNASIENIKDDKWRTLAKEIMGETKESRHNGIRVLKDLAS